MDGKLFFERVRILLHDKGEAYLTPRYAWTDAEVTRRATAAREVLYTTLIERGDADPKRVSPLACNRMIADVPAIAGTETPDDFYRLIMGYVPDPYRYVNPLTIPLGLATPGLDSIWTAGGVFQGTAQRAVYYKRPSLPILPNAPEFTDFGDAFYDTLVTLTCIECVMDDPQDAADRLDDLNEIFLAQVESLN